jgi:NADH-quinone oxidoreductase subunit J
MLLAVFVVLASAAVISAVVVVLHRNPVVSTMNLVVTLVATAGLFILLGSPFLAALQILLYTGAILVLFLFVIMLLNVQRERTMATRASGMFIGAAACAVAFTGAVAWLFWDAHAGTTVKPLTPDSVALATVARELFSKYILPFEMIGLLLLVAVVAASWVAQRAEPADSAETGGSAAPGDAALRAPAGTPSPATSASAQSSEVSRRGGAR